MKGFHFKTYEAPKQSPFDRLFEIFKELIVHTSGDFDEAISWMRELDVEYKLTDENYTIDDFIEDLKKKGYIYDDTSQEGDVPIYPGFAKNLVFWKIMGLSVLFGACIGILGLCYMNLINKIPEIWAGMPPLNKDFADFPTCKTAMDVYGFNAGKGYYVGVTTGAGLVVGILRYIARVPNTQTGFFKEIKDGHVDIRVAPWTFLISTISLMGGANVGPEAALANLGGFFGCFTLKFVKFDNPEDKKLLVLAGMSAALGCLFPFPMLSCLLILELTDLPKAKQGMEAVIVLSFASIVAFSVFYGVEPYTAIARVDSYLDDDLTAKVGKRSPGSSVTNDITAYYYSLQWNFLEVQVGIAVLLGILCAGVAFCVIVALGACKQIFMRIKLRLYPISTVLGTVLPPVIGGLIIGLINMALPMTVGPGEIFFAPVLKYGVPNALTAPRTMDNHDHTIAPTYTIAPTFTIPPTSSCSNGVTGPGLLSPSLLISSMFGKMFCLGISMNCGFIGGIVFPQIIIGAFLGAALSQHFSQDYRNIDDYVSGFADDSASQYPVLPGPMLFGCCCAAVPAAFIPIPYTLCLTVIFLFFFGLYQTVPIFVSVITSYTILCGSGLLYTLFTNADKRNKVNEAVIQEAINSTAVEVTGNQRELQREITRIM